MKVQSFFQAKDSQKSQPFFSYEGSSKDPITGSAKLETGKYQEPEEYPMGEWSPSGQDEYPMGEWSPVGESSFIAESVLSTLGQDSINDPNTSPTSDDLCTTCFPMSEWWLLIQPPVSNGGILFIYSIVQQAWWRSQSDVFLMNLDSLNP